MKYKGDNKGFIYRYTETTKDGPCLFVESKSNGRIRSINIDRLLNSKDIVFASLDEAKTDYSVNNWTPYSVGDISGEEAKMRESNLRRILGLLKPLTDKRVSFGDWLTTEALEVIADRLDKLE